MANNINSVWSKMLAEPRWWLLWSASASLLFTGCFSGLRCALPRAEVVSAPLGSTSDQVWMRQEELGEASDYVIPIHEFKLHSDRLNTDGEDHVKQLAERLLEQPEMPVIIERTMDGNGKGKYKFPVNPDPELDNQRRKIVVRALTQLGVANADQLVVVAPAFAAPAYGAEAEAAFYQAFGAGYQGGSFGNGFGGFGGGNLGGFGGSGIGAGNGGVSSNVSPSTTSNLTSTSSGD